MELWSYQCFQAEPLQKAPGKLEYQQKDKFIPHEGREPACNKDQITFEEQHKSHPATTT